MTHHNNLHNVDQAELTKFSDSAHKWWDSSPGGEFAALHAINPLRLNWIDGICKINGKKVLDVGCGGGILSDAMAKKGAHVLGIDLATASLKVAKLHAMEAQTANLNFQEIRTEDLAQDPKQRGSFDIVTCMEMLEHVPDPHSIVQACSDLVKPGGWVFFSTINRNHKAFLMAIVAAEYMLKLLPKGTHEYKKFITPSELAQFGRQCGLQLDSAKGLGYNPITKRHRLTDDTSVNYSLAMQKINK